MQLVKNNVNSSFVETTSKKQYEARLLCAQLLKILQDFLKKE